MDYKPIILINSITIALFDKFFFELNPKEKIVLYDYLKKEFNDVLLEIVK